MTWDPSTIVFNADNGGRGPTGIGGWLDIGGRDPTGIGGWLDIISFRPVMV